MTSGNNGASTPKDDDPFSYLYADGQDSGSQPPSGASRPPSRVNRVHTVGQRQYARPSQPGRWPPTASRGQASQQDSDTQAPEETRVMPSRASVDHAHRRGGLARFRRPRNAEPRSGPTSRADHGAWTVDRVVRVLVNACDHAERSLPVLHAIIVGLDTVWLRLGTPDERPPSGWTAERDGRTWHAPLRWLQSASVAESVHEPYPRLVSLGNTSDGFVLLNLSQAGGIIGLEGDARQARALAQEWARELSTNPWSRGVRLVRVGFKPDTADAEGVIDAKTLANAELALADEGGGVLLLARMPGGRDGEHICRLADDPEGRWSVVVVGRVEAPRWRFIVGPSGIVDTGLLDEPVAPRMSPLVDTPVHEGGNANPVGHLLDGIPRRRRWRGTLFSRPWLVATLVGVVCLLLAVMLHTPPQAAEPGLTKKEALTQIAHYSTINNQANVDNNRRLLDTVEDGPLYAMSVAEFSEEEALPEADRETYQPWSYDLTSTEVYIPRFYPGEQRWFGALTYRDKSKQNARILIMAEQSRTKRWEMVATVNLDEPEQIPKIALDKGYATAVDATSGKDVAVTVDVLRTAVLDNYATGGDLTGEKVFMPTKASNQQMKVHDDMAQKDSGSGATVFSPAVTEFPDSYALKTSSGGALVVFAHTYTQNTTISRSGDQMTPVKEQTAFTCSDVAAIPSTPGRSKLLGYACGRTNTEGH